MFKLKKLEIKRYFPVKLYILYICPIVCHFKALFKKEGNPVINYAKFLRKFTTDTRGVDSFLKDIFLKNFLKDSF